MIPSVSLPGPELPALGIVADLSASDRALFCSYGHFSFYQPGETIIQEGAPQDALFFLISGELHARRLQQGRENLLGKIRQGESFGEVNIFDPGAASASVVAMTPSQVWRIGRTELADFCQAYPEAAVILTTQIAAVLSRRLRFLTATLQEKTEMQACLVELLNTTSPR